MYPHHLMATFLSRKKQFKEQVQRQFLSRWISSFVITTAIVVVTIVQPIVLAITPAAAEFTNVEVVGDIITYQLNVTDPDNTLSPDSLVLEISNPFESIEEPLLLGPTNGTYVMNYPRYDYRLAIKASKGFGLETLDSRVVAANLNELSGAIASVHIDETLDPQTAFELRYRSHILYSDPYNEVDTISLWWGTLYSEELAIDPHAVPQTWTEVPVLAFDSGVWLESIYNENVTVVMKLVAIDLEGLERILDEYRFMTPLHIYASVYISDVTTNSALASIYIDPGLPIEVDFSVEFLQNGVVIDSREVIVPSGDTVPHYEGIEFWYENLSSQADYEIILYGDYLDPTSGESLHQNISHQTFVLSPPYAVDVVILEEMNGYQITVTVNDTNLILSNLAWSLYTPADGYDMYLDGGTLTVDLPDAPQRIYSGIAVYPQVAEFYLVIRATKTIGSDTYYSEIERFIPTTTPIPTP